MSAGAAKAGRDATRDPRPDPTAFDRGGLGPRVAELFRQQIMEGSWAVGSRIPTEPELIAWCGVGRNTVREAVTSLVESGVLRKEHGRGTFVAARSELPSVLARAVARSSRRDALELRLALDGVAARLAAERRSDADVEDLEIALRLRTQSWSSGRRPDRIAADSALHRRIVAAAGNSLLAEVYDALLSVFEEVLVDDVGDEVDELASEHDLLVDGIRSRDARQAADAVRSILVPKIGSAVELTVDPPVD